MLSLSKHERSLAQGATKHVATKSKPQTKRAARATKPRKPTAAKKTATKPKTKPSATKSPRLLTGGNPQIAKADGNAPVRAYIAALPGWKSATAKRLDALIARTVPKVQRAVKWNSPFYGLDGKGWFLSFRAFTKYVKVTFFKGSSLKPVLPGPSSHAEVRYLDIHEGEEIDEAQLTKWIKQAAALPGWMAERP
jgi:hypothetical protein